jgi:hypothetical protein
VFPSPNVHNREITGPEEVSENCTVSGTTPVRGFAVNEAVTGNGGRGVVAVGVGLVAVVVGISVIGPEGGRLMAASSGGGTTNDIPCPDPPVFLNTSPMVGGRTCPVVL